MHNILIISFSKIKSDPRVMRQIRLLNDHYNVVVAGFGPIPIASIEYIELTPLVPSKIRKIWWALKLLLGSYENYYWNRPVISNAISAITSKSFDLIIANDIATLPLSLHLSGGRPVLLDAHEYSPREFEDKFIWRILFSHYYHYICAKYLPLASSMVTVCQGIANEYFANYGVMPQVVYNSPIYQCLKPSPVNGHNIRIIHHGSAIPSRHIEKMIEVMNYLDNRFSLDFMLVETDPNYMRKLKIQASKDKRIRFIQPVKMADICSTLNNYDIGIYLLPPVNFNHEHALPNKFFEFIQARLAIAIGPSPEMTNIVNKYNCGIVAKSFDTKELGDLIGSISTAEILKFKHASNEAANYLNFKNSGDIMLKTIQSLLDG